LNPRPYQEKALAMISEDFKAGVKKLLLTMPTGSGKTFIFSKVMRDFATQGKK